MVLHRGSRFSPELSPLSRRDVRTALKTKLAKLDNISF